MIKLENLKVKKITEGFDFLNRVKSGDNYIKSHKGKLYMLATKKTDLYVYDLEYETDEDIKLFLKDIQLVKVNRVMKHFEKDKVNINMVIDSNNNNIIIENNNRDIKIKALDCEYNVLNDYDFDNKEVLSSIKLDGERFKSIVDTLDKFRDKKGTRKLLGGIIVAYDGFVALDGYRLGKIDNDNFKDRKDLGYVINIDISDSLKKLLVKYKDLNYNIIEYDENIMIESGSFKVISGDKEYNSFDYNDILRDKNDDNITILMNTKELKDGNKFILDSAEYGYLSVNNQIIMNGVSCSEIVSSLIIENDFKTSEKLGIGYNPKYFKEIIDTIDTEFIEVGFMGELNPIMFRSKGYTSLLLPVRLNLELKDEIAS